MSLLLPKSLAGETLKATGIHLGVKGAVSKDMRPYVTEITPSGNPIMNIDTILSRLDSAGKFIVESMNKTKNPAVVYGTDVRFENALTSFHVTTMLPTFYHRFLPGTLTNTTLPHYVDASLLIVSDPTNGVPVRENSPPSGDRRAMQEASRVGIPVVAFCNTNATFQDVDFCIPANNTSPRAIATVFYLLARSVLIAADVLKDSGEILTLEGKPVKIEDFETTVIEEPSSEEE